MASWKESMISPLSNIINHNHSTTEISQFLCSSNNPVFIRKLYEPHLFPSAPALKIFQKYFGNTEHRYKLNHVQIFKPWFVNGNISHCHVFVSPKCTLDYKCESKFDMYWTLIVGIAK